MIEKITVVKSREDFTANATSGTIPQWFCKIWIKLIMVEKPTATLSVRI
jgi:hypothetical protein